MKKEMELVHKPNLLIMTNGTGISSTQKKIYNILLQEAQQMLKIDEKQFIFKFSIGDIKNKACIKATNNIELKDNLRRLVNTLVEVVYEKDKENWGFFSLLAEVKKRGEFLEVQFPETIRQSIINNDYYTTLDLMEVSKLSGKYAIVLYELAMRYYGINMPSLSIEEFRKLTGTEVYEENGKTKNKAYDNFNNLKARIINPALEELKEKLGIELSYTLRTVGRKTVGINFKLENRKEKKEVKEVAGPTVEKKYVPRGELKKADYYSKPETSKREVQPTTRNRNNEIRIEKTKEIVKQVEEDREKSNKLKEELYECYDRYLKLNGVIQDLVFKKALELMPKEIVELNNKKLIDMQFKTVYCKKAMDELGL